MCRDGEMPARDYVAMVLAGIDTETLISTAETLLSQSRSALDRFADPAWRRAGRADVAAHARRRLAELPAGDDRQIMFVRALARFADGPDDLDYLGGLLDGSVIVDGLADRRRPPVEPRGGARRARTPVGGRHRRRTREGRHRRRCRIGGRGASGDPDRRGQGGGVAADQ